MRRHDRWAAGGRARIAEVVADHDAQVLDAILACRKAGMGYGAIAAYLDLSFDGPARARGMASAAPWSKMAVKRIIDRNGRQGCPGVVGSDK